MYFLYIYETVLSRNWWQDYNIHSVCNVLIESTCVIYHYIIIYVL